MAIVLAGLLLAIGHVSAAHLPNAIQATLKKTGDAVKGEHSTSICNPGVRRPHVACAHALFGQINIVRQPVLSACRSSPPTQSPSTPDPPTDRSIKSSGWGELFLYDGMYQGSIYLRNINNFTMVHIHQGG